MVRQAERLKAVIETIREQLVETLQLDLHGYPDKGSLLCWLEVTNLCGPLGGLFHGVAICITDGFCALVQNS